MTSFGFEAEAGVEEFTVCPRTGFGKLNVVAATKVATSKGDKRMFFTP
jgi:hypothetical protein